MGIGNTVVTVNLKSFTIISSIVLPTCSVNDSKLEKVQ